jgi:iron complex transport system ATP-binding protein
MLEIKEMYFRHKNQKRDVLKNINFFAEKGKITTVLGPNGSGKSTLFKCICGLWKYYRGEVKVDEKSVERLSYSERAKLFSIVPQEHEPPFPYKVFDVVLMGRASYVSLFSAPGKKDYRRAEEALELVGINHLKDIPYTQISGGERQLVLIARALAQDSPVMLLDEPTSHLDFRNQIKVLKKVKEIAKEKGLAVVLTLHDPNLALFFSDKVVMLKQGEVMCNGTPGEVINERNLKKVYGIEVVVINYNGINMVCPKI